VNRDVAAHTLAAGLKTQPAVRNGCLPAKSRMALQAEFASFSTDEHHAVDTSVRIVTSHTAFNFSRGVLVDERAVLVDMALGAGFRNGPCQIESIGSAMSVVTIRALHRSFGNPVMHGQGKLRLYRSVTRVTELWLWRFQQTVAEPSHLIRSGYDLEELRLGCLEFTLAWILVLADEVRRMACIAGNALRRMLGMIETLLQFSRDVAGLAAIRVFLRSPTKTENQLIRQRGLRIVAMSRLLRICVSLTRAVTRFARHGSFAAAIGVCMGGLSKLCRFRFVTPAASRIWHRFRRGTSGVGRFLRTGQVDSCQQQS